MITRFIKLAGYKVNIPIYVWPVTNTIQKALSTANVAQRLRCLASFFPERKEGLGVFQRLHPVTISPRLASPKNLSLGLPLSGARRPTPGLRTDSHMQWTSNPY